MTKETWKKVKYFGSSIFLSLLGAAIFGEFLVVLGWLIALCYKLDKSKLNDLPEQGSSSSSNES